MNWKSPPRLRAVVFIRQAVFQGANQEGAEAPSLTRGTPKCFVLQHVRKEGLRQVLCVRPIVSLPAQKTVDCGPISAAERGESGLSPGTRIATGSDNHTPGSFRKTLPARRRFVESHPV